MTLTFLASSILIIAIISYAIKKSNRQRKNSEKSYWDRENEANSVRRKPLDNLPYVHIPLQDFPTHLLTENTEVAECIEIVTTLADKKVVNLTGYSNTDLKLEYGAPNIIELSEYDQNYTLLARTLQKWADALMNAGYTEEAVSLMEYAVSTDTDVSKTYYCLADYRYSRGEFDQIEYLLRTAEGLRSPSKNIIVRNLKEKYDLP